MKNIIILSYPPF